MQHFVDLESKPLSSVQVGVQFSHNGKFFARITGLKRDSCNVSVFDTLTGELVRECTGIAYNEVPLKEIGSQTHLIYNLTDEGHILNWSETHSDRFKKEYTVFCHKDDSSDEICTFSSYEGAGRLSNFYQHGTDGSGIVYVTIGNVAVPGRCTPNGRTSVGVSQFSVPFPSESQMHVMNNLLVSHHFGLLHVKNYSENDLVLLKSDVSSYYCHIESGVDSPINKIFYCNNNIIYSISDNDSSIEELFDLEYKPDCFSVTHTDNDTWLFAFCSAGTVYVMSLRNGELQLVTEKSVDFYISSVEFVSDETIVALHCDLGVYTLNCRTKAVELVHKCVPRFSHQDITVVGNSIVKFNAESSSISFVGLLPFDRIAKVGSLGHKKHSAVYASNLFSALVVDKKVSIYCNETGECVFSSSRISLIDDVTFVKENTVQIMSGKRALRSYDKFQLLSVELLTEPHAAEITGQYVTDSDEYCVILDEDMNVAVYNSALQQICTFDSDYRNEQISSIWYSLTKFALCAVRRAGCLVTVFDVAEKSTTPLDVMQIPKGKCEVNVILDEELPGFSIEYKPRAERRRGMFSLRKRTFSATKEVDEIPKLTKCIHVNVRDEVVEYEEYEE
ncbi:hypothetical protein PCE1_000766 [Barthelona sp. PCE]